MTIDKSFNFRRVSKQITTSGTIDLKDLGELRSEGYEVVIDLLPGDSEYAIEGEREIIEKQGIHYIHIPVDFSHPTLSLTNWGTDVCSRKDLLTKKL